MSEFISNCKIKKKIENTLKHTKFHCIAVYSKAYPSTDYMTEYLYLLLLCQQLGKLGKFISDKMQFDGLY